MRHERCVGCMGFVVTGGVDPVSGVLEQLC